MYGSYISAYGSIAFCFVLLLWSSEQATRILTNVWLTKWTTAVAKSQVRAVRVCARAREWFSVAGGARRQHSLGRPRPPPVRPHRQPSRR